MAITPDRQAAELSVADEREARRFFDAQAWRLLQMSGDEFIRRYDAGEFAAELDGPRHRELAQLVMLLPLGR